jgi:N utilization substance protein A
VANADTGEMEWHAADGSVVSQSEWVEQAEGEPTGDAPAADTPADAVDAATDEASAADSPADEGDDAVATGDDAGESGDDGDDESQ